MLKKISLLMVVLPAIAIASSESNREADSDNTKVNRRDQNSAELTAEDQSRGSAGDVELTRKIRSSITSDDALSTNAHNIKIITLNGQVTLKGPVKNAEEKNALEKHASKFAQRTDIRNQLEITPSQESR